MKRIFLVSLCLAVFAATSACTSSKNPAAPVAPSADSTAASDGSTLKVSAPPIVSPVSDFKLTAATVTLVTGAAVPTFASAISLNYHFQVFNPAGAIVQEGVVATTSFNVAATLVGNARYTWRVRAEA